MNTIAAPLEIPSPSLLERSSTWLAWLIVAGLLAWSWQPAEMSNASSLITDWRNMAEFASAFGSPNFHDWEEYAREMLVTIQIALWGTFLAVLVGIPFAVLSSANVAPQWIVQPVRRLMDAFRAINELVFALFFVVAVGLGPFAGVMALFVHNTGVVAKLFSEAIEAIDPRPVEGIRATGATRLHEVLFGVIPQVIPLWSSFTLYRFETNVRSATVLGIVGAGGIGQYLWENVRSFLYAETAAIIIIVVASVSAIDLVSAHLRKRLI
ncbi:MAG: phosphonate transport system permease protein [Gammaproteobacteria bacterium]|jgi:phosphonate transport system permease protein